VNKRFQTKSAKYSTLHPNCWNDSNKFCTNHPIFGPCLLWPNGWMDQDSTWCGDRPRSRRSCVRRRPSSSLKGAQPQFSANVYCGQTAGWMKMPLGTEVDLGSGHIVLDGGPASPRKGHNSPPLFGACLLWSRSPISATAELLWCNLGRKLTNIKWYAKWVFCSIMQNFLLVGRYFQYYNFSVTIATKHYL